MQGIQGMETRRPQGLQRLLFLFLPLLDVLRKRSLISAQDMIAIFGGNLVQCAQWPWCTAEFGGSCIASLTASPVHLVVRIDYTASHNSITTTRCFVGQRRNKKKKKKRWHNR
mmetsp:Transcript_12808/g.24184  ORF Transcript_12808/g.24184 Transcript_12808/m.24184 type:complete len:113 (-) Transcript_12808:115-453(-)